MRRIIVVAAVLVAALSIITVPSSDADTDGAVLFDRGNGSTDWYPLEGATVGSALTSAIPGTEGFAIEDGTISACGITERTVVSVETSWRVYIWENGSWSDVTGTFDPSSPYTGGIMAVGFYPEGVVPTETPQHRVSWTSVRGDSALSGHQDDVGLTGEGSLNWSVPTGKNEYVCSTILAADGKAVVFNGGGYTAGQGDPTVICTDIATGNDLWTYSFAKGAGYETATGAIYGGYAYIPATNYNLYRIPLEGPGENGEDVKILNIPRAVDHTLIGTIYNTGPASVVFDSGVLYFGAADGYVYCVDKDLNILWKTAIGGRVYSMAPMIHDGRLYIGALDGTMNVFDQSTGELSQSVTVFTKEIGSGKAVRTVGLACPPVVIGDTLFCAFNDGQGMNNTVGGIAGYRITDSGLEEVFKDTRFGLCSNYMLPVGEGDDAFLVLSGSGGLRKVLQDGTWSPWVENDISFRAPLVLLNGNTIVASEYDPGCNTYLISLDGKKVDQLAQPEDVAQYCMSGPVVVEGYFLSGTDGGYMCWHGSFSAPVPDDPVSESGSFPWALIAVLAILVLLVALVAWFVISKARREDRQIKYVVRDLVRGTNLGGSKVRRNKRRLAIVLTIGAISVLVMFFITLAFGPSGTYSIGDTFGYLVSAIGDAISGQRLDYNETIIFDSRCSRAVATFFVGMGLSVSGCIYQAIIRNPMVDPYIMGVSAGAGVAAVAVIAFDFTMFGLLDNVTYATPIVAMVGGLLAFAVTMLLAEKAGGSSLNYVLAGVIVGLIFSAAQTLLMSMAGNKLQSAISWLFGSFANIGWTEAILIAIPALALSLVPLVWAKEFNLVLLGEEQDMQMGLDVRRFNRWMLILASVLASVCVAFVGIIGFVGLVVPHLCRMVLGGDHRLVMPASMVVGGALMMAADFFAKMVMVPMELPVGAITTIIGAPVFAYLLIRKGRMYDG
ncbi:MAG: iron chelate uptake ABC transporter family permease subunit [Candidatus Methanomethylophilaceae archaeon]|nr:iron chelate uptake ABC transporter family permease subunit [Candidatus Methanomethylophilaceae archaeon]